MTDARFSHGMVLRHRVQDAGDYHTVGFVLNQNVPNPSRQKITTTPHSSKFETSIAGRITSYSDLQFSVSYLPSTEEEQRNVESGMDPDDGDGRVDGWQIETPDGERWTFKGFVTTINVQTAEDDQIMAEFTVAVTGKVTHDHRGVASLDNYGPSDTDEIECTLSDPDGSSSVTYQWQRKVGRAAWANIASQTSDSYTVEAADDTEDDFHAKLRCKVTYTDSLANEERTVYTPQTAPAVA